jgi:hypothetical protein
MTVGCGVLHQKHCRLTWRLLSKLEDARRIITAAEKKAKEIGQPMNIAVAVISLKEAPQGYRDFDSGVAKKFVLDPHGLLKQKA